MQGIYLPPVLFSSSPSGQDWEPAGSLRFRNSMVALGRHTETSRVGNSSSIGGHT
jgi:hypothetical protein